MTLITPRDATDRGLSSFTGHLDRAYPGANIYEQMKLAMARAAIEASRAAGTLFMSYQGPPLPERREDIDNMKLQALRYTDPAALDHFPAAGIDSDHQPVQAIGPSGLSAEELQRCKDLGEEVQQ